MYTKKQDLELLATWLSQQMTGSKLLHGEEKRIEEGVKARRIESYESKEQQSKLFRDQEQECHLWLSQNRNQRKTAAIMVVIEQMVEMRYWKQVRGLIDDGKCRVCFQHSETVEYLVPGCR